MILAVGGPLDQTLIDSCASVIWGKDRASYFRYLIFNKLDKYAFQFLYLHRTEMQSPPDPGVVIKRFVATPHNDFDPAIIAHYWWLMKDYDRFNYARFL
jgi:hypothetical protein